MIFSSIPTTRPTPTDPLLTTKEDIQKTLYASFPEPLLTPLAETALEASICYTDPTHVYLSHRATCKALTYQSEAQPTYPARLPISLLQSRLLVLLLRKALLHQGHVISLHDCVVYKTFAGAVPTGLSALYTTDADCPSRLL